MPADYFDEEGVFAEDSFMLAVKDFVAEYEQLLASGGTKKDQ